VSNFTFFLKKNGPIQQTVHFFTFISEDALAAPPQSTQLTPKAHTTQFTPQAHTTQFAAKAHTGAFTHRVNLKFKPPMRPHNLSKPLNPIPAGKSKYFVNSTFGHAYNTPSTTISSGLKRTKVASLAHGEADITAEKEPKQFKPLSLEPLQGPSTTKSVLQEVDQPQAFVCLYRKLKHGTNATWDGDGILSIVRSQRGRMAVLKDSGTRQVMGSMLLAANSSLKNGALVQVGSREVEIQGPATESELFNLEKHSQESTRDDWTDIVKNDGRIHVISSQLHIIIGR
jgi:hypothetical protein